MKVHKPIADNGLIRLGEFTIPCTRVEMIVTEPDPPELWLTLGQAAELRRRANLGDVWALERLASVEAAK